MQITSLMDLFHHELQDLYSAEKQIIEALPKMMQQVTDPRLIEALEGHLEVSRMHLERLEKISLHHTVRLTGHTCKGIQGIIAEAESTMKDISDPQTKDAAIIAGAQRVEHYEIAGYGTARAYARELGDSEAERLLDETLSEESATDDALTHLAEGGFLSAGINQAAIDEEMGK